VTGDRAKRARVPEFVSTAVRKVEPVGGGMVRVYYALERNGAWDDQFTMLMPIASVESSNGFVIESAREIAEETSMPATTTH
jgi:hypothetical protein